jgi:uncharacterized protein YcbX
VTIAVAEVTIYPVKSCRGLSLSHARVVWNGLEYDRSFMVVDGAAVASCPNGATPDCASLA